MEEKEHEPTINRNLSEPLKDGPAAEEMGPHEENSESKALNGEETGKKPDTPIQEQKNMEVYHYPNMSHKPKHFKEYFLEFLMIFFAVTMGFFAESIRQYIADKEHVRQLCGQLVQDLKNDSAILNDNISKENLLVKKSDSLFHILQQPLAKSDSKKFQELIIACYNINLFQPSSGAMLAIKTDLHLKQFANSNITLYISNYETDQALLKTVEQFQMANLKEYIQGFITAHFTSANAYSSLSKGTITNGEYRNLTQNDLIQLSVEIMIVKNYNAELAEKSTQLKDKASQFIQYVIKEFNL
jgi:hypothetical protein